MKRQAKENLRKAGAILELYNNMKPVFIELIRSQYTIQALDWIFEHPIFKSPDFIRDTGIPKSTAQRILGVLKKENMLTVLEESRGRKASVFAHPALLNIAEGRPVF